MVAEQQAGQARVLHRVGNKMLCAEAPAPAWCSAPGAGCGQAEAVPHAAPGHQGHHCPPVHRAQGRHAAEHRGEARCVAALGARALGSLLWGAAWR